MSKTGEKDDFSDDRIGVGITAGAAFGAGLGLLFDDVTQGIVIGVVTGMFVALVFEKRAGDTTSSSD